MLAETLPAGRVREDVLPALAVIAERTDSLQRFLAQHTRLTIIRAISAGDRLLEDSLVRKADELQAQLAGEQPTALERLAVERVVASWLQLQQAELLAARSVGMVARSSFGGGRDNG